MGGGSGSGREREEYYFNAADELLVSLADDDILQRNVLLVEAIAEFQIIGCWL